jgi:subtilisin family serine protease
MRLAEAHAIAKGGEIRIAVIDSGIDPDQPELSGAIVEKFDALKSPFAPHSHGTAIAALIAGHNRLMGSAPEARILAVRAFDPAGNAAEATTFNIIRALDWAVVQRARIINMSFAGPADPGINRALDVAFKKNIVLIAAAGNAGAKSPPLYPAANPNVIAVAASDSSDQLFPGSNRGRHIAVAAPGVDILVAVPFGGYEVSSGTSYSAASVSGIVALMLQRKPDLTPAAVRDILLATAKDVGKKGRDDEFGAGIADAYRAVSEVPGGKVSDALPPK